MAIRYEPVPTERGQSLYANVYYFDADWEEIEELTLEDATYAEALLAVRRWLEYRADPRYDGDHERCSFPKVHCVSLEVQHG